MSDPADPDETAGRQLYRARADTLASAQVNYQRRGKRLVKISRVIHQDKTHKKSNTPVTR
jgi:hypothetical protein